MKKIFAANWKLHKTPAEARRFLTDLRAQEASVLADLWIFPPASAWEAASATLIDSTVKWGAQNIYQQAQGAFTGENSALVLRELGGHGALVGHSERRKLFGETDGAVAEKVAHLHSLDLAPMICIGETLPERQAGQTDAVNRRQLTEALGKSDEAKPVIVAYEPVWAIGTGQVATADQVRDAHAAIHGVLKELGRAATPILYGGSVKPDNAGALLKIPFVDGFLIGGASLEVASFLAIARA